jgi:hypothetical protein
VFDRPCMIKFQRTGFSWRETWVALSPWSSLSFDVLYFILFYGWCVLFLKIAVKTWHTQLHVLWILFKYFHAFTQFKIFFLNSSSHIGKIISISYTFTLYTFLYLAIQIKLITLVSYIHFYTFGPFSMVYKLNSKH